MRALATLAAAVLATTLLHVSGAAAAAASSSLGAKKAPTVGRIFSDATLTVSGISAGGAMAVQYEVAFSGTVRAAGVIAGVPYFCGMDDVYVALDCMSSPYTIDGAQLIDHMQQVAALEAIDALENLKSHAVLLFSGTQDTVVSHGTMVALAQQYTALGLAELPSAAAATNVNGNATAGVRVIFDVPAEHAWVTNTYGNACAHLGSPYLNNCGVDFAGEFLQMAWAHMGLPFNKTPGRYNSANMQVFSQAYFGAQGVVNSLDSVGYVYVPRRCQEGSAVRGKCNIHVNFHGCEQQRTLVGDVYVVHTGLNEWAETNDVVVIYPQTVASQVLPYNPKGCFDWWGYAGPGYATKGGAQVKIINAIVEYLLDNGTLPPAEQAQHA